MTVEKKSSIAKWNSALDAAYRGHGYQLKWLKPVPKNVDEVIKTIESGRDAFKRDLMKHLEDGQMFIADVHYEIMGNSEDALIDAIDEAREFKGLRSAPDIDVMIGNHVRIRIPGHYYDGQSGVVVETRRSEFLIQVMSKKVPIKTKTCNKDAKALVWVGKKDLRKV